MKGLQSFVQVQRLVARASSLFHRLNGFPNLRGDRVAAALIQQLESRTATSVLMQIR